MLGPVLTNLDVELLDPLLGMVRWCVERVGGDRRPVMSDEVAEELGGAGRVRVEYMSSVHMAQKAAQLAVSERFVGFVMSVGNARPEALMNVDFDELVRSYARELGVDEKCLMDADAVAAMRSRLAAAQERQSRLGEEAATAKVARDVGGLRTDGTVAGALAGTLGQ